MIEMSVVDKVTTVEVVSEKSRPPSKKRVKIVDDKNPSYMSNDDISGNDPGVESIIKNDNKLCNNGRLLAVRSNGTVDIASAQTGKTEKKGRKLSIGPKFITLPNCDISRGLLMAFIFLILIFILIIWFLFSNDNFEATEASHNSKRNSYFSSYWSNRTYTKPAIFNSSLIQTPADKLPGDSYVDDGYGLHGEEATIFTNKLFIFSSTFLIVLSIIAMVFIVAIINYYKKPTKPLKSNASIKEVFAHTLFTHRSHHGHLYYIEQAEKKQLKSQQERLLSLSQKRDGATSSGIDNLNSQTIRNTPASNTKVIRPLTICTSAKCQTNIQN